MEQRGALAAYNELYKEQDDLYRAVARGFGLSDCAFWVLYALREAERPMTQSDVCAAVYQPKQTVHSALKKLEGEGFLRLAEGRDRRSKRLTARTARRRHWIPRPRTGYRHEHRPSLRTLPSRNRSLNEPLCRPCPGWVCRACNRPQRTL